MATLSRRRAPGVAPPEIRSVLRISVGSHERPWSFSRHRHDDFLELSLITQGEAYFECDHGHYRLEPGDLAVKNAGVLHSEHSLRGQNYEQLCICLSGALVSGLAPHSLVPQGASPVIATGRAFQYLRATFSYLFDLASIAHFKPAEGLIEVLERLLAVIMELPAADCRGRFRPRSYSPLVAQVVDYLNSHFDEALNLETMAKAFYVSPSYLSHKFKDEVGVPLSRYLAGRKLGEAQMQLAFKDWSIKEIAADCGYSTLQHFYPEFKKHTGTTPRLFRDYYRRVAAC